MNEIYKVWRPKLFKQVIGQSNAVETLSRMLKRNRVPHTILFSGPSGCGKTTLARIMAAKLGCGSNNLHEVNAADDRGIDMVRNIRSKMSYSPMGGGPSVWIIDEAQQLTSQSQNSFLKSLEDTPEHVYFMLCSTDPHKLAKAIRTRCTDVKVDPLSDKDMEGLVNTIAKKEKIKLATKVVDRLVQVSDGSARRALVLLHQIRELKNEKKQLNMLLSVDGEQQAIQIARLLLNGGKWNEIAAVIKGVTEEPESIRWMVLGYCSSVVLGGGKLAGRAYLIIDSFRDNYFDTKKAGLIASCWEVVNSTK